MTRRALFLAPSAALLSLLLLSAAGARADAPVTGSVELRGSAVVAAPIEAIAEAFMKEHPGIVVTYSQGTSGQAIKGVLDRTLDVGIISSRLPDEAQKTAQDRGLKLIVHPLAREIMTPLVNADNPVPSLTIEQLRGIFHGRIVDWKDVGGKPGPITVLSRDPNYGEWVTWMDQVVGPDNYITPHAIILDDEGTQKRVAQDPSAIGYGSPTQLVPGERALAVDGVAPNREGLTSGKYPITRQLSALIREPLTPAEQLFFAFMEDPAKGGRLVEAAGFTAPEAKSAAPVTKP